MLRLFFGNKGEFLSYTTRIVRKCCIQAPKLCWNCQVTLTSSNEIFCSKCERIQKPVQSDYFQIFQLDQQFLINQNDLIKKFRNLQSSIHPDKFSGKTEIEQEISAEWSSLVNKAYKILSSPIDRAEYLLKLRGISIPEQNTIDDPEFLMEMMEKNEQVENASTNELKKHLAKIRDDMTQLSRDFAVSLKSGNLDEARTHLIKMKYLTSIEKSIKEKSFDL